MTSRDFCYWLQGYFEISEPHNITEFELKLIQAKLNSVEQSDEKSKLILGTKSK